MLPCCFVVSLVLTRRRPRTRQVKIMTSNKHTAPVAQETWWNVAWRWRDYSLDSTIRRRSSTNNVRGASYENWSGNGRKWRRCTQRPFSSSCRYCVTTSRTPSTRSISRPPRTPPARWRASSTMSACASPSASCRTRASCHHRAAAVRTLSGDQRTTSKTSTSLLP